MLITDELVNTILLDPINENDADELKIVSGYATPTMASWHIKQIEELNIPMPKINLIVGMYDDGIPVSSHNGFISISNDKFVCQYVYQEAPVDSKLFVWLKNGHPVQAYMGSANYTQPTFSVLRRELMTPCDPFEALDYFNSIENHSIYCTHSEIEEYVRLTGMHPIFEAETSPIIALKSAAGIKSLTLSHLAKDGSTGSASGLNWGQRSGRNPNEAYIRLPVGSARSGFFPLNKSHFMVVTDDKKSLILRAEQQNDKAITTPQNNALIGVYFRYRLGLPSGAFVTRDHLEEYGRTDVTFYKLDDEQYFMDFSV